MFSPENCSEISKKQDLGATYKWQELIITSLRQLIDAEKKICVYNKLLDRHRKDTEMFLTEDEAEATARFQSDEYFKYIWLAQSLTSEENLELSDDESTILYYVAGYVGRAIAARNECSVCQEILVQDSEFCFDYASDANESRKLLDMANRGGLVAPTEYVFLICTLTFLYYQQIISDDELKQKWLSVPDHLHVYFYQRSLL